MKVAIVLTLVLILPCVTTSYADSSSDDMHPVVECLSSIYDVFVYPSFLGVLPVSYNCYDVLHHYLYSDIQFSDEIKHLMTSVYNKVKEKIASEAWKFLGKLGNKAFHALPDDGYVKRMLAFFLEVLETLHKIYYSVSDYYSTGKRLLQIVKNIL